MSRQFRFSLVLALVTLALLVGVTIGNGNVYSGLNIGISWDWGGVELAPTAGVYLCTHAYNVGTHTSVPQLPAVLFPQLAADC